MSEKKVAIAICAHPDDIEFGMAGTLYLLGQNGYKLHYMTIANGNCGSLELDSKTIVNIRREESKNAAKILGAKYHDSLCDDFNIFNTPELQSPLCDVIRKIKPDIVLTQSPQDYMHDHEETSALVSTAVFYRTMQNSFSDSKIEPTLKDVRIYHAQPHGNCDQLGQLIRPSMIVDVSTVIYVKKKALKAHVSQDEFLRKQQGIDAYAKIMMELNADVARLFDNRSIRFAEGWRLHNWRGYCSNEFDPLSEALKKFVWK